MEQRKPDFSIPDRVISGRWMLSIMRLLRQPRRFGEIQMGLGKISRSVLAAQLQELQEMDLIAKTNYHTFPPRMEYVLTEKGRKLLDILIQTE